MLERIAAPERGLADQQHAARIVVAAGDLAELGQRRDVGRPLAQIGHERHHQIALADGVKQFDRAHDLELGNGGAPLGREFRRRSQHDVLVAEPRARHLAVIGGPQTGRGLVIAARLILAAQRLGGAALPIAGPRMVVGLPVPWPLWRSG